MSIRLPLLALLMAGPLSAEQLDARLAPFCGDREFSRTLAALTGAGLVEKADPDEGTWRLTDDGRASVGRWFSAPVPLPDSGRTELVLKVSLAAARRDVDLLALLDR